MSTHEVGLRILRDPLDVGSETCVKSVRLGCREFALTLMMKLLHLDEGAMPIVVPDGACITVHAEHPCPWGSRDAAEAKAVVVAKRKAPPLTEGLERGRGRDKNGPGYHCDNRGS